MIEGGWFSEAVGWLGHSGAFFRGTYFGSNMVIQGRISREQDTANE